MPTLAVPTVSSLLSWVNLKHYTANLIIGKMAQKNLKGLGLSLHDVNFVIQEQIFGLHVTLCLLQRQLASDVILIRNAILA